MSKVISVANNKGGVAKTTTTEHLGIGLAKAGYSVLLIDSDPQGSLSEALGIHSVEKNKDGIERSLGAVMDGYIMNNQRVTASDCVIKHEEGVYLLPAGEDLANIELKLSFAMMRESIFRNCIEEIREKYDYILIDGSPSLNLMMINILNASDTVLIPFNAEHLAKSGIVQLISVIANVRNQMNQKLTFDGVLVTMFNASTNNSKKIAADVYATLENFSDIIQPFKIMIPRSVRVAESSEEGVSIYRYAPDNPASLAYVQLTTEIIAKDHPDLTDADLNNIYEKIMEQIRAEKYVPRKKTGAVMIAEEELKGIYPEGYSSGKIKSEILYLLAAQKRKEV